MKSGTSYLFSLPEQHPEVSPCKIKEPEYFVKDHNNSNGLEEYYKLWDFDHNKHKVALEASTSYTKLPQFPNAAERIKSSGINAKIIYLIRHPIKRIRSQIQMSRCFDWQVFDSEGNIHSNATSISSYHFQISEYSKRFPAEQILLLSFEKFTDNPKSTLMQICKFLEIDNTFHFDLKEGSKHAGVYFLYQNTLITRNLFGISSYEEYLDYIRSNKRLKKRFLIWYLTNKSKLKLSQKRYLKKELAEDLKRLELDYGFDTSLWKL